MSAEDADLLDFLQEPAFILEPSGRVLKANRSAKRIIGHDPRGRNLMDFSASTAEEVRSYLSRCSGTTSQQVGSLLIIQADDTPQKFRLFGARLPDRGETTRLAVRCVPSNGDQFSVLARNIKDLNSEIGRRRATQAHLEESLRGNEVLLRELHHRVKNNIQLMIGLLSAGQRESGSREVQRYLTDAINRLVAIGAAQQIIYEAQEIETVPAPEFIKRLCDAVRASFGPEIDVVATASPAHLDSDVAFPLALIINELLTNAMKHNRPQDDGKIDVSLHKEVGQWVLIVQDNGPGIAGGVAERRSSGLGLVRGLARQIGGSMTIENAGGARVTVRFQSGGAVH